MLNTANYPLRDCLTMRVLEKMSRLFNIVKRTLCKACGPLPPPLLNKNVIRTAPDEVRGLVPLLQLLEVEIEVATVNDRVFKGKGWVVKVPEILKVFEIKAIS